MFFAYRNISRVIESWRKCLVQINLGFPIPWKHLYLINFANSGLVVKKIWPNNCQRQRYSDIYWNQFISKLKYHKYHKLLGVLWTYFDPALCQAFSCWTFFTYDLCTRSVTWSLLITFYLQFKTNKQKPRRQTDKKTKNTNKRTNKQTN